MLRPNSLPTTSNCVWQYCACKVSIEFWQSLHLPPATDEAQSMVLEAYGKLDAVEVNLRKSCDLEMLYILHVYGSARIPILVG